MKLIKGRVWKYGDDINTDVIFPGKYVYTVSDPSKMAVHALEDPWCSATQVEASPWEVDILPGGSKGKEGLGENQGIRYNGCTRPLTKVHLLCV